MRCLVCDAKLEDAHAICGACIERLDTPPSLCPEHFLWVGDLPAQGRAALIDPWGRPHFLLDETVIGREPEAGLAVLEGSVSGQHVVLSSAEGGWQVRDLGSRNGTAVGDAQVTTDAAALESGDRLVVGDVAMYFVEHERLLEGVLVAEGGTRPSRNRGQMRELPMRLAATEKQGGGAIDFGGASIYLSPIQFELVRVLVSRMINEATKPAAVRGFVSSRALLDALPWSTAYPTDNNLKQLVRRVRRAMTAAGAPNPIESRQGFGYRLQFIPRSPPTETEPSAA